MDSLESSTFHRRWDYSLRSSRLACHCEPYGPEDTSDVWRGNLFAEAWAPVYDAKSVPLDSESMLLVHAFNEISVRGARNIREKGEVT